MNSPHSQPSSPVRQACNNHELDDHRHQSEFLPIRRQSYDSCRSFSSFRTRRSFDDVRSGILASDDEDGDNDNDNEFEDDEDVDRLKVVERLNLQAESKPFTSSVEELRKLKPLINNKPSFQSDNATEEHDLEGTNGILLNKDVLANNTPVTTRPYRPRRLTSSSIKSDVEETGSRVSLGEETEEDVCFPILPESHTSRGIDFQEIDLFIETIRYGSEGCDSIHESDSILPEKTTNISGLVGTSEKKIPYASESVLFNDSNLNFRNSVQKNRDSNKFLREDGSIYNGGAQWPKSCIGVDRFSFFSSESEETIHALDFPSLIRQDQTFSDLFKEENGAWWLDCLNPTDAEMRMFTKAFGIHPLTAEDIRTQENREKVELFKSYYFVCFHTFNQDSNSDDFLKPVENYMVVFKNGILSFHFAQVSHPANVRRRARQLRDYVEVSADWICYALIDDITDSFAPFIHLIEREADIIEEAVLIDRETDFSVMLRRIGEARRKTMSLMRLLAGKADVIKMFAKRCNEHWDMTPKGNIGLYLGDIQDHIVTMYQNLLAYEKILSRSHGNYLAQLQVESFNANNRVTDVLGKVTVLGTCLLPLNLVTGLWGMNVHVPGQDVNSLGWFFGIAGCIIGLICTFILMTRIWLQGKTGQSNSPAVSTAKGSNGSLYGENLV